MQRACQNSQSIIIQSINNIFILNECQKIGQCCKRIRQWQKPFLFRDSFFLQNWTIPFPRSDAGSQRNRFYPKLVNDDSGCGRLFCDPASGRGNEVVHFFLNSIPSNFQLLTFNFQLLRGGAYCKKRIFLLQETSETKQMLIHFFDLKKELFPLFWAFPAITTVLFAIMTVLMCSALGTSRRLARS